jgi:hypothetical protein
LIFGYFVLCIALWTSIIGFYRAILQNNLNLKKMKKISKMSWVKIILTTVVLGTMVFFICKWNVSLDPPREIALAKTQILVDIVIPNVREYEFKLPSKLEFTCENDVNVGDTVQLKYFNKYIAPHEVSRWELVSIQPPFYENTEFNDNPTTGSYTHIEYMKGIVRVVVE